MVAVLTFRTEGALARPAFDHGESRRRRAEQSEENEPQRRHRQVNERKVRRWSLAWPETGIAQVEYVRYAYDQTFGGVLTMTYTPVGEADVDAVEAVFVDDSLTIRQITAVSWSIELEVEEVL